LKTCGRRVTVTLLLVCFIVFCGTDLLLAQRRGGTREGQSTGAGPGVMEKIVPMEYDTMPFDITRGQLPPAYGGHNAQAIYNSVQNSMARGAAAGVAEGQDPGIRMTRLHAGFPLTGTLKAGSTYAFQVTPADISYNKREQMMRVYCQLWTILAKGTADKAKSGFRVDYIPQVDNRYAYTTADGKKIEIEEVKFRECTVAFENLREFPVEKSSLQAKQAKEKPVTSLDDALKGETIVAHFPAAKAEAGQLERNVRLLVLCNLASPYATSEILHEEGTPEKPGEYLAQHQYLHVRLLELWFYDASTGKVFMKIGPGQTEGAMLRSSFWRSLPREHDESYE